ncbi:MAG: lysophospholipid acyltransferase family protein [Cucumibacter sp.]
MILQAIRSILFWLLFLGQTAILAIPVGLMSRFAPKLVPWWIVRYWFNSSLFLLHWVAGVATRVTGAEHIPSGGCIIAAKHQSDWDILALLPHTPRPAFIAKKEMLEIPFFGWAARRFETIRLDRALGGDALPDLIEGARGAISRNCQVIIFPEGTRRPPLAEPDYRWGAAKLYVALGVPVVPVALTSGLYWPPRSLILWPGTARAQIMPPIEPGLSLEAFQERLLSIVERATEAMLVADLDKGISAPVGKALRERVAALKKS